MMIIDPAADVIKIVDMKIDPAVADVIKKVDMKIDPVADVMKDPIHQHQHQEAMDQKRHVVVD